MTDETKPTISMPGEWALKKLLGPVLGEIGQDMKKLYANGRNRILANAYKKIENNKDGKMANLRVTRDVLWNGSFTDEAICAEYFGGILAASRSEDGKDDSAIYYVNLIKSLSSKQLLLHYILYTSLNKIFASTPVKKHINVGNEPKILGEKIYLLLGEISNMYNFNDVGLDLHILNSRGLVSTFSTDNHKLKNGKFVPYLYIAPSTLGIQLFAIAYNKMNIWRDFTHTDFGKFEDIKIPKFYAQNINLLLEKANIKNDETK